MMEENIINIRLLDRQETLNALPDLCDVMSDCVNGGASVGFMLPFGPDDSRNFWQDVAEAVGRGTTLHAVRNAVAKWLVRFRWVLPPSPTSLTGVT